MPNLNQTTNAIPVFLVDGNPQATTAGQPAAVSTTAGAVSYEDQRVFDGFGYTVSTSVVSVSASNYLMCELANPAGSGVNYVMAARVFSNNVVGGNAPLEYQRYASASAFPAGTPTVVPINNRIAGGPANTGTFRFLMAATQPTGTITSSGFIPTNGEEKRIRDIVIIAPGQKLIYSVGGAGGGLAAMARVAMTFLFYTRPI